MACVTHNLRQWISFQHLLQCLCKSLLFLYERSCYLYSYSIIVPFSHISVFLQSYKTYILVFCLFLTFIDLTKAIFFFCQFICLFSFYCQNIFWILYYCMIFWFLRKNFIPLYFLMDFPWSFNKLIQLFSKAPFCFFLFSCVFISLYDFNQVFHWI